MRMSKLAVLALLIASTALAAPLPLKVDGGLQMKPQATTTIPSRWWGLWNKYGAPFWFGTGVQSNLLAPYPGKFSVSKITTVSSTTVVAVCDFNGDGVADIATGVGSNVAVFLNAGSGTFATVVNYAAGTTTSVDVVCPDFNNDGFTDIVSYSSLEGKVYVLLGTGSGTFNAAVGYVALASPRKPGVGDFNGDGFLDLAVPSITSENIAILINSGTGTFGSPTNYSSGVGVIGIQVIAKDLNNDGKQDLVAADLGGGTNTVRVLLGDGSGGFGIASGYAAGVTAPTTIALGDFNGDGVVDIVSGSLNSNNIGILLGIGNGTFSAGVPYANGVGVAGVTVADFNHDGVLDVGAGGGGKINIFYGVGNGTFTSPTGGYTFTGTVGSGIMAGDFNGDGRPDIGNAVGTEGVAILLNSPTQYVPYNATPAFNCAAGGSISMTLTANLGSWTIAQGLPGDLCTLTFIQGDASTRTIGTPPANIAWLGTTYNGTVHSAPVLTTATANAVDTFVLKAVPTYTGAVTNGQATMWQEVSRCMACTHP